MFRILYLVEVVLVVLAAFDVLRSRMDTEKKILWMLVIIFMPILGAVAWYAIGRNRNA